MKKEIANTLSNIVSGNKKIYRFYDEAEESSNIDNSCDMKIYQ